MRIFLFFFFMLCGTCSLSAQPVLHLLTDRDEYGPGDTIWAKVFALHDPSTTLFWEVSDTAGKVYLAGKFPRVRNGFDCTVRLSDGLPSSNYIIRAYTSIGKKSLPGIVLEKLIAVHSPGQPSPSLPDDQPELRMIESSMQVGLTVDTMRAESEGDSQLSFYLTPVDTLALVVKVVEKRSVFVPSNNTIATTHITGTMNWPGALSPDTSFLSFNGRVSGWKEGMKPRDINGILQLADLSKHLQVVHIDKAGRFSFSNVCFEANATLLYPPVDIPGMPDSGVLIVNRPDLLAGKDTLSEASGGRRNVDLRLIDLASDSISLLGNVTVRVRKGFKYLDSVYTSNVFSSVPDYSLDVRNEKYYSNLFDYLRNKLVGFECRGAGCREARYRGYKPVFYLDEKLIPADQLLDMIGDRMDQVAYIKAYVSFVGNGAMGNAGAIVIYRKKQEANHAPEHGWKKLVLQGYSPVWTYTQELSVRPLLLWDPDVLVAPDEGIVRLIFRFKIGCPNERKLVTLLGVDSKGRVYAFSQEF